MHDVDPDHLELESVRPFRLCIDGDEVVLAGGLQAVSRVEEHAGVRSPQGSRKIANLALEGRLIKIEPLDHQEAMLLEHSAHVGRVVGWICELWRVLIGRVANYERDALLSVRKWCHGAD